MSNMPLQQPKAVSSRSTVNEPGPRGSTNEARAPRGPGSATIDLHLRPSLLNGKAFDSRSQAWAPADSDVDQHPQAALTVNVHGKVVQSPYYLAGFKPR
jgi:hypothetical protein